MNKLPWYKEGLPFACTGCGKCCGGFPGYVWVNDEEIKQLASHLNLSVKEFTLKYLRLVNGQLSLREKPGSYDCVFLEGKKCSVYELRPTQCRTFPFWPENVSSPEAWKETARHCEGINPQAPIVPFDKIQTTLQSHST